MDPVEMHRVLDIRVFQNCSDVCSGCLVAIEDMAKLRCINKLGIKREIFLLSQLRKEIQTFLGLFRDLLVGALPRHDPETRSAKIGVELHTLRFLRGSILLCQEVEQFTYVSRRPCFRDPEVGVDFRQACGQSQERRIRTRCVPQELIQKKSCQYGRRWTLLGQLFRAKSEEPVESPEQENLSSVIRVSCRNVPGIPVRQSTLAQQADRNARTANSDCTDRSSPL